MRQKQGVFSLFLRSPSSRRAWIEIVRHFYTPFLYLVALLAEGVDRNIDDHLYTVLDIRRPPRGGRG